MTGPLEGRSILLVSPSLPHPPIYGFAIRVYQLIRELSRGNRVTLLAYAGPDDGEKVRALCSVCEAVHTVTLPRPPGAAGRRQQLASLLSPLPHHARKLRSRHMQEALDGLLARQRFDVVQVESSPLAALRFPRGLAVVLDEHNIEYELLRRTFEAERSLPRKAFNWLEHRKFERHERGCWQRVSGCVMTSERELRIVRELAPGTPSTVVPNGVDLEYFRPAEVPVDPASIVFTGLMSYRPNADAAVHFVRDVLPLIRRARPDARFTAVGWGVPEELKRLLGPGVAATGRVPDVRPYLGSAAVVVAPLRMGGGTRLKILESLAMARPMVSTSLGCEGLDVRDGEHLLVADDPGSFARSVLRILDDPALGSDLGRRGRLLAERRYSWDAIGRLLAEFQGEVLEGAYAGGRDSRPAAGVRQ